VLNGLESREPVEQAVLMGISEEGFVPSPVSDLELDVMEGVMPSTGNGEPGPLGTRAGTCGDTAAAELRYASRRLTGA